MMALITLSASALSSSAFLGAGAFGLRTTRLSPSDSRLRFVRDKVSRSFPVSGNDRECPEEPLTVRVRLSS